MTAQIIPFPVERRKCGEPKGLLFRCVLRPHPDQPDAHRCLSEAEIARLDALNKNTEPKGPRS